MPDTITTPDALMGLSNELSDFPDKLDDFIKEAPEGRHRRGAILKRRRHPIMQERQPC